jgi:hypothetical protein
VRGYPVLICLVLAGLAVCGAQQTSDYTPDKNWKQVCERAKAAPLPSITSSGPLTPDQLAKCDETALYYGLGLKPDYAAALRCGWSQRVHPQHTVGNMFYGPGVLTMLYANGQGVPRNYDLAIRFACENEWAADAENEYRIGHLERLRDSQSQSGTFDLCDDITSGLSDGACTNIRTKRADAARAPQIAAMLQRLPISAKSAFPSLEDSEHGFETARIQNEVDLSGTSRAAFQLTEKAKLRDQFLINLQRFGKGDITAASSADLAALDRQLNETYQRIQASPASKWEYGTIKPEGIHETERKWVSLADAWIAFARVAYPKLSETAVRVQLILRLHQLRSLGGN